MSRFASDVVPGFVYGSSCFLLGGWYGFYRARRQPRRIWEWAGQVVQLHGSEATPLDGSPSRSPVEAGSGERGPRVAGCAPDEAPTGPGRGVA